MTTDLGTLAVRAAHALAAPVLDVADPSHLQRLLYACGWTSLGDLDLPALSASLSQAAATLREAVDTPPSDVLEVAQLVGSLAWPAAELAEAMHAAQGAPAQVGEDLLDGLLEGVLNRYGPTLPVLQLLGVVDEVDLPAISAGAWQRRAVRRRRVHPDRLITLFQDPGQRLFELLADPDQVVADLWPLLIELAYALGVGATTAETDPAAPGAADLARILVVDVPVADLPPDFVRIAAGVEHDPARGLVASVACSPELALSWASGPWHASVSAPGVQGLTITRDGITFQGAPAGVAIEGGYHSTSTPAIRFGSPDGLRLEIDEVAATVGLAFGEGQPLDVRASLALHGLTLTAQAGDGFLHAVLGDSSVSAVVDLDADWSLRTGLTLRGDAGLDVEIPLNLALGPLRVGALQIAVRLDPNTTPATISVIAATTFSFELGPFAATVTRMGLEGQLALPAAGTASPTLQAGFKPPAGAGLVLDAGPVAGGGYLCFDPDQGQYAGAFQLEFKGIALKAVGIITTKLPDGSDGFSLLLIISAEFTPIQLGFGFTLNGVGGLLALNRTAAVDVLQAGIKNRTLDSIMFPKDPVAHAAQVIADLSAAFPVAPGRFVIGPMARLAWGTPALLTFDLGLLLELPPPIRLVVMGRLRMALPSEEAAVVVINLDALGVLDFGRGEASIDATLYDSRIAAFTLTGDMALRAGWGERPGFALALGGFHPRFSPPPGFPALNRLAIALSSSDNPRLRLESYLALTSNTAQFGGALELYVAAAGFALEGRLSFDALFQFEPFRLLVDLLGSVALKLGSRTLFAVQLILSLSGPAPWHVTGRARFTFLFLPAEVSIDTDLGGGSPPPPPTPVDVESQVAAALGDARNWSAQLPPEGESLVSLRQLPEDAGLLVHPLGTVGVTQRVAPLGVTLQRLGTAPIRGATRMDLHAVRVGSTTAPADRLESLQEYFAPAQYLDLSDAQKLARPSFERYDAGRRVRTGAPAFDTCPAIPVSTAPEVILVDAVPTLAAPTTAGAAPETAAPLAAVTAGTPFAAVAALAAAGNGYGQPSVLGADDVRRLAAASPAARSRARTTGPRRFAAPALSLEVAG